jgi:wobble nucleotide-excising tRNase
MLRSFTLDKPFRCLQSDLFQEVGLGKKTVIYGHNGSGKSTLSSVLSALGSSFDGKATWVSSDRAARPFILGQDGLPENLLISVFNKEYVAQNLASFLDGANAASIITLGDAVGAKKEEDDVSAKIAKLETDRRTNAKALKIASAASLTIVRSVQTSIESNLKKHDFSFTKNKYNDPVLRKLLAASKAGYPQNDKRIAALDELSQPVPDAITPQLVLDQVAWTRLGASTESLLRDGVLSELLASLVGEATLQKWVLEGLELHEEQHSCAFCAGPITPERRVALRKHFDESRKQIQNDAKDLMRQSAALRDTLKQWLDWFPDSKAIHPTLRADAVITRQDQQSVYSEAIAYLDDIDEVLKQKHDEPERTDLPALSLEVPNFKGCSSEVEVFVAAHNELCESGDARRAELTTIALDNFIGSSADAYRKAAENEALLESEKSKIAALARPLPALLATARAKQFSSQKMADQINADLASVYGRKHLRIEVAEQGKAYRCWRDTEPASNLSEGEKNTLALIYFLRHLQDESLEIDPKQRIVVVDDPSSSLDRESVYATHSWLLKQLNVYGQYVILTHDFELLRLLLGSLKNQVGNSRSNIGKASKPGATPADILAAADEKHFPAARFLEITARSLEDGSRSSKIEAIPDYIINHISEYHYLFDRVMRGIENPDEVEGLFLLPNAARRMLESFSRFKRPDLTDFLQAMEAMTQGDTFRDVYDFCNKHSHGEGRELSQPLDRHSVKQQIERAVEFMTHIDADHVNRMKKATGRADPRKRAGRNQRVAGGPDTGTLAQPVAS